MHEIKVDLVISRTYDGGYDAIDRNIYDCDHDGERFYPTCPVGWGPTPYEAAIDLFEKMFEENTYKVEF